MRSGVEGSEVMGMRFELVGNRGSYVRRIRIQRVRGSKVNGERCHSWITRLKGRSSGFTI